MLQSKNGVDRGPVDFQGGGEGFDIFEQNISETQMWYWFAVLTQPCFSLAHKIDGRSFLYYCTIVSAQQVWWHSENSCCLWKGGQLSCRLPKCNVSISSFFLFEAVYISLIGDIFLLPSIPLVLASDSRAHDSILKAEWPKSFSSSNRLF